MLKFTLLAVLLLAVAIDDSLAKRRRGGGRSSSSSEERHDLGNFFGRGRGGGDHRARSCEVTYNDEVIPISPCDDDEFCSALTVTRDQDTATFKFCNNRTFEIEPKMACRIENETSALLVNKSCLVGECNSAPFIYNNIDDDDDASQKSSDDPSNESSRRRRHRGGRGKRLPEGNLTLTFCNAIPTAPDYAPLLLGRACSIKNDQGEELLLRNRSCRSRGSRTPTPCPDGEPLKVPFQGEVLDVYFCETDFNITELFGGNRGDDSDESESDESDDEEDSSESSERGRGGRGRGRGREGRGKRQAVDEPAEESESRSRGDSRSNSSEDPHEDSSPEFGRRRGGGGRGGRDREGRGRGNERSSSEERGRGGRRGGGRPVSTETPREEPTTAAPAGPGPIP